MNIVQKLQKSVEELALSKNLNIFFTQTNHSKFACTSRIYIAPKNTDVKNCNSNGVLKIWEWNQPQDTGTTNRCKKYRILTEVKEYLN